MSKATTDVLLWANRIVGRREAPPHELLEIAKGAALDDVQTAFHKIARLAHPDLHRTTLSPDELEHVTTAYAIVASAYQDLRVAARAPAAVMPIPKPNEPTPARGRRPSAAGGGGVVLPGGGVVGGRPGHSTRPAHDPHASPAHAHSQAQAHANAPTAHGPGAAATTSSTTPPPISDGLPPSNPVVDAPTSPPRGAMSSKAMVYYRKAEFALKSGELKTAQLNLRLAIAADPQSQLLRGALAEVEAELGSTNSGK